MISIINSSNLLRRKDFCLLEVRSRLSIIRISGFREQILSTTKSRNLRVVRQVGLVENLIEKMKPQGTSPCGFSDAFLRIEESSAFDNPVTASVARPSWRRKRALFCLFGSPESLQRNVPYLCNLFGKREQRYPTILLKRVIFSLCSRWKE